ncbi:NAD(P)H-binding protein [Natronoarchaeum mannanilyticum]|uniref:NAD(P)H-binding protein n=1 Tax=Natronoarchaeum mannanilyticum TaxID=926360 RepID=A0AAV3TAD4_9EURY
MHVLLTGATGFIGGRLGPALVDAGHRVTALVRDADRYDAPAGIGVVEGDLLDPGSFEAALADVDAAYYLVHSMGTGGDFAERDRRAASNFTRAADAAGVERVIYLGGLGEQGGDDERLSGHLRSRQEVAEILGDGTFELTTLRAAIVVGAGSTGFEIIDQLTRSLPVMVTPKWVRTPCQPIAVDDVVAYLTGVLDAPATAGGSFEIGGPEVLSYQEMLVETARVAGRRLTIVPVPVLTPRLSAYWVDLVTDVPRSVAHPLIEGLKTPVVVENDSIREHVDVELTPFATAVERAFERDRGDAAPAAEAE